VFPSLAPPVHLWQVREEQARAPQECAQLAVIVRRERVNPSLHICEVAGKQCGHILEEALPVRGRASGSRRGAPALACLFASPLREPPHGCALGNVPSHSGQLSCRVCGPQAGGRHPLLCGAALRVRRVAGVPAVAQGF
jgi:hypothetical protein